jgi:hypothetical protein
MGLLDIFSKSSTPAKMQKLPSGSFTMDRSGKVVASTLPQSFGEAHVKEIGQMVLAAFLSAKELNLPLTEIIINYGGLKITAREQRGGAMIFLAPRSLN